MILPRPRRAVGRPWTRRVRVLPGWCLLALGWLGAAGCGGRPATEATSCSRIVALAPSAVEIVFALGLGPRVVGVGDYATFPPEVASLPHLGGLTDPSLERLVSLRPDLAVLLVSEGELAGKLGRLGIPTVVVGSDRLQDLFTAVSQVAAVCHVEAAGTAVGTRLESELAPVVTAARPRVFLAVDRRAGSLEEVLSAGPQSFLGELLERAGGSNLVADSPTAFPRVSLETVLARQPDLILELQFAAAGSDTVALGEQLAADWRAFPQLRAVAANRIRLIAGPEVLVPGPRLGRVYAAMVAALAGAAGPEGPQ